ncbi:methyltransferase domain-containing protein [Sphingomonas sp. BGYR3]|uniref:methyltransferase domain-containing protein n=1 Tax=Sphingomonas sp. BGYR3 TaxID=2975483 RepID=UPI0021A5F759|nr:methyltransferase domain-containing protein [Sphingomonas sp. BGYR3]MDG5489574.1 methyltransferase domain-containing protein [Sphingomonas sp. BGYR3]
MSVPEIFDRNARRLRRNRIAGAQEDDFLRAMMIDGLADRLDAVTRSFSDALEIGCGRPLFPFPPGMAVTRIDPGDRLAAEAGGIAMEEDRLSLGEGRFDLIVSAGLIDQVSDLPGALTLIRRALRPDGLFLAAFAGAGSLSTLKAALLQAEADRPAARVHPQIDVRSAGDLLMRAGFALPVADVEPLTVRYGSIAGLFRDLRAMAATNLMVGRTPLSRAVLGRAASAFSDMADPDGRTAERFDIVYLTGWAPDESQPKPARRGSATASLLDALKPPRG